jgi:type IV pilus assembly protein PilC
MSDLKQGIKSAAVYPMFMLFVGTVILGFMMVYVVPMFSEIFLEFGGELPPPTRFLIRFSNFLQQNWHIAAVLLTLFFAVPTMVMNRTFRSKWFNEAQDSILHKIPMVSSIHYRVTLARFFQTLATLLHARVPIVESLRLAGAASGSLKLQHIASELALQQENGFDLSQAMALSHHFTNHMCWLVSMGEKNNDIERSLESLAESLDRETRSLDNIVLLLTMPILTIGIGLVFGFIVVALYLPIFTLGDSISGG